MRFARIFVDRTSAAAILLIALAVLGAFAPRARAQAVAIAEIDGYVTDPSGQAIVGAQVKATEVDKGQVRDTVSEATGRYALPDLPVGNYKLEVSAPGFKTYVQTGIVLQVASNVTLNVPMQLGSVTESVRVEANAAMVETKPPIIRNNAPRWCFASSKSIKKNPANTPGTPPQQSRNNVG